MALAMVGFRGELICSNRVDGDFGKLSNVHVRLGIVLLK